MGQIIPFRSLDRRTEAVNSGNRAGVSASKATVGTVTSVELPPAPARWRAAHPALLWVAIAVAYALIEIAIWTELPARITWFWIATAFIAFVSLTHRPAGMMLGVGRRGFRKSLWVAGLGALLAGVILTAARLSGTLHPLYGVRPTAEHALMYAGWAIVQQFILQSFFYARLEKLFGDSHRTAVFAAVLFATAHIPNPVLVPVTLAAGLITCELFRRYRNIYPLGIAHGLVGLALAISLPDSLLRHMRVGIGYLHFVLR